MAWYSIDSISIANGDFVVSVSGNVDLSQIKAGWMFYTGTTIAEVKSGTAPNGLGLSEITLEKPWEGVTATVQKGLVVPTSGALLDALKGLEETNSFAIATHKALSDIATLDADVTINDSAGNEHTFASLPKNARLIQELLNSSEYVSENSTATGDRAAVIASHTATASGDSSLVMASGSSTATATAALMAGSNGSHATASYASVLSSNGGRAQASYSSVVSSYVCNAQGGYSKVDSSNGSLTYSDHTTVLASLSSSAGVNGNPTTGRYSAVIASYLSSVKGTQSLVAASSDAEATGSNSLVLGSTGGCEAAGNKSLIMNSQAVAVAGDLATVTGCTGGSVSGAGALMAASNACNVKAGGSYTGVIASDSSTVESEAFESAILASSHSIVNNVNSVVMASTASESLGGKSSVISSADGHATDSCAAVISSATSWATSARAVVLACDEGNSSGVESLVMAAKKSTASARNSIVGGSELVSSGGVRGTALSSYIGAVTANDAVLMASRAVDTTTPYALAMGYHQSSATAHVNNQTIRLEANGGVGRFSGGTTTTGFDYAEYFENLNVEIIPAGTIVTLENGKVRKAELGEFILGTVSKTYGVLGNSPDFHWHKRYMKDEWGGCLTESVECISDEHETRVQDLGEYDRTGDTISITNVDVYQVQSKAAERWEEVEKEVQEIYVVSPAKVPFKEITATRTVLVKEPVSITETVEFILIDGVETALDGFDVIDNKVIITEVKEYNVFIRQDKIENPDYEDKPYSNRSDRPNEYTIVGLLGQLFVTVYEDINKPYVSSDGLGCDSETPLRAMRMSTPFDSEKGYGVCFCLKK